MSKRNPTNRDTAKWTLRRFFAEVFIPNKMANGLKQSTARMIGVSVSQLEAFLGYRVQCNKIDEMMLRRWQQHMIEKGLTVKTARERMTHIRGIVRSWRPDRFPMPGMDGRSPGQAPLALLNADVKGTLEQILVDDYLPQRMRISADGTIRQYKRCIVLFGHFLEHPATPADLTDRTVGKFLRWLVNEGKVKAVTANSYVKQIRAIWTWLAKLRVVDKFPTIDKLPQEKPIPTCWSARELEMLVAGCRAAKGCIGSHHAACDVWLAFHLLCWDSGERTGAMLALRWEWLEWETGYLSVPGEFRKGRQKPMIYLLKKPTLDALRAIEEPRRKRVFDMFAGIRNKNPSTQFYPRYRQLIKDAGLPYVKNKSGPQKMRRSFASFIEAGGGNATRALKHVDRRCTEDSYLDPRIAESHHENEKLFEIN